jgi:exodeoxyribonuclease V alpha subunit
MPNPLIRESRSDEYGNSQPLAVLECVIERVTFHNADNGYSVVKVSQADAKTRAAKEDVITVLGSFTNPIVGESLRCHGQWIKHPQYGPQFRLERYETLRPATATAIEKYLGSGMVKGVGPVMAKRIVAKFGEKALDIIDKEPEKLTQVSGIGEKRITLISEAWKQQREIQEIMRFLLGHGVSPTYAVKIYRQYKERSIEIVEQNPYQLASDIWGVGFKSADKIAQNIGFAEDAPARLEAGLVYVLNQEMENGGHCFLYEDDLIKKACEILLPKAAPDGDEVRDEASVLRVAAIEKALQALIDRGQLDEEAVEFMGNMDTAIYTPSIHTTEKAVADRIHSLLNSPWRSRPKPAEIDALMAGIPDYSKLSDEQQQAVRRALCEPLLVLTGGPGCGKTFTTKVIVAAFEKLGKRLQIASPTGRAAKRAAEVTGKEAKTIHRLLEFDPTKEGGNKFKHGPGEPLELDALIVDESSMLDIVLMKSLIQAIPDGAHIIFVGDVDQLPSVGPGNVLADLINSGRVPVARLTQVFRQAAQSQIITNAHAINRGKMPELLPPSAIQSSGADCVFVEVEESEEMPDKLKGIVAKSLPRLGYRADEITVLAPMQRGTVGARNLNDILQTVLNPPRPDKEEQPRGAVTFRVGDRVMQRRNNYDKNVYNGDVGHIIEIDKENQTVAVDYPEQTVEYDFADIDELSHAFSLTVHKSQGSEYPACVIALHTQHYMMLQRNLVYTALTRAKKIAVFVGSKRAIQMAVRNRNVVPRNTRLAQRLQNLIDDLGPNGLPRRGDGTPKKELPTPPLPGRLF